MVGMGLAQSDFVCGICGLYLLFPLCPPLVFPFWPLSVKTAHLLCWIQAFLRCKFEVEFHDQVLGIKTNGQAGLFSVTGMLNSSFGSGEMAQQLRTLPFVPSIHVILLTAVCHSRSKSYMPLTSHTLLKIKINRRKFSIFVCRGFHPQRPRNSLHLCHVCRD